mgnify:CR=1 FL=1
MLDEEFLPVDKILARKRDSIQNFPTIISMPKSQLDYSLDYPNFPPILSPATTLFLPL